MNFFKRLFNRPKINYKELVDQGAIILDVRTSSEFKGGHIKGSKNIPLNTINGPLKGIKKDKVLITCCASGMRSASAAGILKSSGYTVYNGGGWRSLQGKLK